MTANGSILGLQTHLPDASKGFVGSGPEVGDWKRPRGGIIVSVRSRPHISTAYKIL